MLSPVALAAGDFLTWRIRLPDSGSKFSGRQIVQFAVRKTKNHCLANGDSSSPPCEKGEKRMEQYTTQMDAARYRDGLSKLFATGYEKARNSLQKVVLRFPSTEAQKTLDKIFIIEKEVKR